MANSRAGHVPSFLAVALLAFALPAQAAPGFIGLDFRVVDAEYSAALERIVMVSAAPNQLHVFDPLTAVDVPVDLPLSPTSVSVGPDGLFAAVGHDGWVSYVDLAAGSLVKTMPVSTVAVDVVLAGNGFVYVFPKQDQWQAIRCIEIATENETLHTGRPIYAGTVARLHPGGTAIYGANRGLSPSDIEKYSIAGGTASYLYDSPYHGDYEMCGDLWISEDGLRIFTACGKVFRASDVQAEDMRYGGSLSGATHVRYAVHSAAAGKVLVVADQAPASDTVVQVYDQAFLAFEGTLPLPDFVLSTGSFDAHGRFVFFSGDGSQRFAIVQADPNAGLLNDYAVVLFDTPQPAPPCDIALDDVAYSAGDLLTASVMRLANPSDSAAAVEWKVWLATPYGDYPIVDVGAKGVLTLPAGFDYDFGPVPLFTVPPGTPAGTYGIHCRVLDPVTGKARHLDENPFLVQ
jgi:hypothetical protein